MEGSRVNPPSPSPPSPPPIDYYIDFKVGELYDVLDGNLWRLVKITHIAPPTDFYFILHVHFHGFPEEFDEEITIGNSCAQFRRPYTHTSKLTLTIGDAVDIFSPELSRWIKVKILETREVAAVAEIRVLSKGADWIKVTDECLALGGSRSGKEKNWSFPGGNERAIAKAKDGLACSSEVFKARAHNIFEELRQRKLLPRSDCMEVFDEFESRRVPGDSVEHRRWSDAKAASLLEAAFSSRGGAGQAVEDLHGFTDLVLDEDLESSNDDGSDDSDDSDTDDEESETETFFDERIAGVNKFLRYGEYFPKLLDASGWSPLPARAKVLLQLADLLECRAWRSNSVVKRRLLFAESALLIRIVLDKHHTRELLQACNWRLSRHYVNGLGVDTTELELQDSADIQACEYFRQAGLRGPHMLGTLAMMLSVGRSGGASIVLPEVLLSAESVLKYIKSASECGVPPALYWGASLLLQG